MGAMSIRYDNSRVTQYNQAVKAFMKVHGRAVNTRCISTKNKIDNL